MSTYFDVSARSRGLKLDKVLAVLNALGLPPELDRPTSAGSRRRPASTRRRWPAAN
jgi:hypothetical protein